jgi:hypothetical protein
MIAQLAHDAKKSPCSYLLADRKCPLGAELCHMGHRCPDYLTTCKFEERCKFYLRASVARVLPFA